MSQIIQKRIKIFSISWIKNNKMENFRLWQPARTDVVLF